MKKFIYLISPQKIDEKFYDTLRKVLQCKNVRFFQLRLKKIKKDKIVKIAKKIRKITRKFNVKLIINDHPNISKITNADGCHLGQKDGSAKKANLNILKWAKRNIKKPIIAIGGINNSNYKKFIKCGAKYIALSSYIWDNPKLKPEIAIRKFK